MTELELSPKSERAEKIVIEFKSAPAASGISYFALLHHQKDGRANCVWVGRSRKMARAVAEAWKLPIVDDDVDDGGTA